MRTIKGLILVLGSPNSPNGELYSIAKERCNLALAEFAKRPGWKILLTGGFGPHFNTTDKSHAEYLKRHLTARGIPDNDFVEFAPSSSTQQDASLSKPIVLRHRVPEILVVTSDYHAERARYIFEKEFADTDVRISFSLSKTDPEISDVDLDALIKHERHALRKLKNPKRLAP
jgi:uncharacterized SAM-binding protein YcdF (DUF218 family)